MKNIYVDSCVYISYLTNEMNEFGNTKGEKYFDIFEFFYSKKYKLVISTHVLFEIKKYLRSNNSENDFVFIQNLIKDLKNIDNVMIVRFNDRDKQKAKELDPKNYPDALHVILALKHDCDLLTTENLSDFQKYNDLIKVVHPKDLL